MCACEAAEIREADRELVDDRSKTLRIRADGSKFRIQESVNDDAKSTQLTGVAAALVVAAAFSLLRNILYLSTSFLDPMTSPDL